MHGAGKDVPYVIQGTSSHITKSSFSSTSQWTLSSDGRYYKVSLDDKAMSYRGRDNCIEIFPPLSVLSSLLRKSDVSKRLFMVSNWLEFLLVTDIMKTGRRRKRCPITRWLLTQDYFPGMQHTTDGYTISILFQSFPTVGKHSTFNGPGLVEKGYSGVMKFEESQELTAVKSGVYHPIRSSILPKAPFQLHPMTVSAPFHPERVRSVLWKRK